MAILCDKCCRYPAAQPLTVQISLIFYFYNMLDHSSTFKYCLQWCWKLSLRWAQWILFSLLSFHLQLCTECIKSTYAVLLYTLKQEVKVIWQKAALSQLSQTGSRFHEIVSFMLIHMSTCWFTCPHAKCHLDRSRPLSAADSSCFLYFSMRQPLPYPKIAPSPGASGPDLDLIHGYVGSPEPTCQ